MDILKKYVHKYTLSNVKMIDICKIIINRAELWHTRVNPKFQKCSCFMLYKIGDFFFIMFTKLAFALSLILKYFDGVTMT